MDTGVQANLFGTKLCPQCGEVRSRGEFAKHKGRSDGLQWHCKYCQAAWRKANSGAIKASKDAWNKANAEHVKAQRAAQRKANFGRLKASRTAYRQANRAKVNASRNAWKRANRAKLRASQARWQQNNRAKLNAQAAARRKANPEKVKASQNAWWRRNPMAVAAQKHIRRARKLAAGGSFTAADITDIRRLQRDKCALCRKPLKGKGTIDHIIPFALGGTNDRRNLQLTHARCNSEKQAIHPIDFAQRHGLLL